MLPFSAFAETDEQGGIAWSYKACEGGVEITSGMSRRPAIPSNTVGRVVVPMQLGGQPVVQIGNYAFYGCASVTDVAMSNDVREVCDDAFCSCRNLVSVALSSNLVTIGRYAFQNCTALRGIEIPNSVTNIGKQAFWRCRALTSVVLSDGLKTLGRSAFSGCSNIVTVAMPPRFTAKDAFPSAYRTLTSVTLPDDATEICASAFEGCKLLGSLKLPPSLIAIGSEAFSGCSSLTDMMFPEGLRTIGRNAFQGCTALRGIEIPNSVTNIGKSAFWRCRALTSVVLSDGLQTLDKSTFSGCSDLREVVLPASLLNIEERAFSSCKKVVTVTLPARFKVKDVFASAYRNITSVTIPQDSGEVPAEAFYGCKSLTVITFPATPPALADDAFRGLSEGVRIVVPSGSVPAYAASADWRGYLWRIEADGEYPIIYALHRGENAAGNPLSYRTDRLPLKLDEPTKAGHVFHGWLLNGERVAEIPTGTTGCISLTASWRIAEPIEAPTADYVTSKAQYDGIVWDAAENRLVGVLRLKATKMNEKNRTVRISGYLLGLDGKKKTVKQNDKALLVPETGPLSADFTVKDIGQMKLVIGGETVAGALEGYQVRTFPVGGNWTRNDAVANVEATVFEGIPGTVQMQLLPVDEPVMPKNLKWAFNRAAAVAWKKPKNRDLKCLVVDTSKGKTNLSGIKLSYTPKTGAFKGSFKIYALEDKVARNEKTKVLKKYTVKVTGVVVDGIGYGEAVLKKPANAWALSVD